MPAVATGQGWRHAAWVGAVRIEGERGCRGVRAGTCTAQPARVYVTDRQAVGRGRSGIAACKELENHPRTCGMSPSETRRTRAQDAALSLGDFIRDRQQDILIEWLAEVRALPIASALDR